MITEHQCNNVSWPTVLVSLLDSGFDEDSAAGGSDFTFCFNGSQPHTANGYIHMYLLITTWQLAQQNANIAQLTFIVLPQAVLAKF